MISTVNIKAKGTPRGCHAFSKENPFTVTLKVVGASCEAAWFYMGDDSRVILQKEIPFNNLSFGSEKSFETSVTVSADELGREDGLFFCHFEFISEGKRFYTAFDGNENAYISDRYVNEIQIVVYNEKYACPEWLVGGAMYQIFPDRFARGGDAARREDAVYDDEWDNGIPEYPDRVGDSFPNNKHFGGTLYGVADKLSYLSELGINCIYLNPIFDAYSNHKYDTCDFLKVDKTFGGDESLAFLVEKAHEKGIKVILDGVFNHVGDDSIYFDAYGKHGTGACVSTDSPYFGWFDFSRYPDEYESWWGIRNLPKIVRNESYIRFITEEVIPKYMNMGIDGWRLDVADELEADFLDRIANAVKACKPDALIIGEVWEDASNKIAYDERKRYFRGNQLDAVTNYPFRNAIIDFVQYGDSAFLADTVSTLYRHYPPHKLACLMNFLGSHDTERIATVLGGEPDMGDENDVLATRRMSDSERERAKHLLKNAYLLLACLPGVPCIYYGDEIALEGYHDPFNRRPFPSYGFDDDYSRFFARVNNLRKSEPLFKSAEMTVSELSSGVVRIDRIGEGERLTVLANMSDNDFSTRLEKTSFDIINGAEYNENVTVSAKTVVALKQKC
jgi:glycosidase